MDSGAPASSSSSEQITSPTSKGAGWSANNVNFLIQKNNTYRV